MLLALAGVTGVGKSYYKDKIVEKFNFKKVNTIRTRAIRAGEKEGQVGLFMTSDEIDNLEKSNEIAYRFKVFGGEYAYLSKEIFSKDNMVFEMHYTTIDDWKKIRSDLKAIYILPSNLEFAIQNTLDRHLSKEKETERILEIQEQYNTFITNKDLQSKFDYIVYNNFDKSSEDKLLDLINKIINKG